MVFCKFAFVSFFSCGVHCFVNSRNMYIRHDDELVSGSEGTHSTARFHFFRNVSSKLEQYSLEILSSQSRVESGKII